MSEVSGMNIEKEIQQTFKQMVLKNATKISVQSICTEMNISRKTFYKYYIDKYDLIKSIIHNEIFTSLTQLSQMNDLRVEDSITVLNSIYSKIYEDREFYKKLNQLEKEENIFYHCIYQENMKLNEILFQAPYHSKEEKAYHVHLAASSGVAVLMKWMDDDFQLSPRQISEIFYKYVTRAWVEMIEEYKG